MAGFTTAIEQDLLDHFFGKATFTPPSNYFVALLNTLPFQDDGSGISEVSGGSYARVSTAPSDWNAATGGEPSATVNANAVTFTTATATWGTINGFALYDASTSGNLLVFGPLGVPKVIGDGDTAEFAVGTLMVKLGDPGDTF